MKRSRIQYAKDEIVTNLYTTGLEYMYEDTYEEYVGPYHMYTTGEIFTEFNWKPNKSKKLIKYQNIYTPQFLYKKLKPNLKTSYDSVTSYVTQPTQQDLNNGYFFRYFMSKLNENIIFEIDESGYNKYLSNEYDNTIYLAIQITWQLSGVQYTTIKNGIVEVGVYEKNKATVLKAESSIRGIINKLTNYLEFYIGDTSDIVIPKDING